MRPRIDGERLLGRLQHMGEIGALAGGGVCRLAPNCPTAMIFVPSVGGLSHNIAEHTEPADLVAGAEVLLDVALDLLGEAP